METEPLRPLMAEGNDLSLKPRGPGIPDSSGQAIPPSRYFIKPGLKCRLFVFNNSLCFTSAIDPFKKCYRITLSKCVKYPELERDFWLLDKRGSYVWIFILLDGHQFIEESQSYPGDFLSFLKSVN